MTRVLALGDTQIGVQTVTLESQAQVLYRIADAAIDHKVDLVLHGGDVFEGPVVLPEHLRVFIDFATRLRAHGIPLLVLRGNGRHDMATREVHALDVLHEIDGITVSDRAENIVLGGCVVSTLPWTKVAEGGWQLSRVAAHLRENIISDAGWPHILALHWSVSGASLPTGLPVDQLHEPVIEWADLDALGFDCVIASHIHKAQRIDHPELGDTTPGFYTGSPQPLNHGESGYEHGVWVADIEAGSCSLEFIAIDAPQFVTHDLDLTTDRGIMDLAALPDIPPDAIVRVRFRASAEQARSFDYSSWRYELLAAGASRVTIEPQVTRDVRARSEAMTQELDGMEAMLLYCKAQKLEPLIAERMGERLRDWIAT